MTITNMSLETRTRLHNYTNNCSKYIKTTITTNYYLKDTTPRVRKLGRLLPKDKESWLEFLSGLVKSRICINFLSDKELKQVIERARPNIGPKTCSSQTDPDLPECYSWTENQTGNWISVSGFPHLKDVFIQNRISGRKLVMVDANALVKMGLRDLNEIRDVSKLIRDILGVPRPNMMRALMRLVPFENYLRKRVHSGKTYDGLSFQKFCDQQGFPYKFLKDHDSKNAQIPCTCPVELYPFGMSHRMNKSPSTSSSGNDSDDEISLVNAPTVEFVTRNVIIHNKIVQQLIDEILGCIFEEPGKVKRKCNLLATTMDNVFHEGFRALKLRGDEEKMEFVSNVTQSLFKEMLKTAQVLQDIEETRLHIKKNVTEQTMEDMRRACGLFIEQVLPIISLLSLGQLTLESIFRQEPTLVHLVDSITHQAEMRMDATVSQAQEIVQEVIDGAEQKMNQVAQQANQIVDCVIHQAEKTVNDNPKKMDPII